MDWQTLGRMLAGIGVLLLIVGLIMMGLGRFFHFGSLPGDIVFKKGNFTFYFPIVTCLVLSIILSLLFRLFLRR
ncbi:DUF2905 domain-containing protein [Dehalobacterium formicoaceticum]|uniref:DUF2905 domain-containing protein n=1 Tax=Dehalobacterium formicoaceticum TaxID=51515 RepID=A0ABT1YAX2_9FIRM|nr:DUF2905 domain-containing protein [Dehalobacterium formicoaceticum]MCR6546806.1 DUF2905 domain-containing protein [Dehalobacterium formicoaceticum]